MKLLYAGTKTFCWKMKIQLEWTIENKAQAKTQIIKMPKKCLHFLPVNLKLEINSRTKNKYNNFK